MTLEHLKYPIGKYNPPAEITPEILSEWINDIASFPARLEAEVKDLALHTLSWPYRPGGWTIKQVVHHCSDSHMNAWMRFKFALTEDNPAILPYNETIWATTSDSQDDDLTASLQLLKGLHAKFAALFTNLSEADLKRTFYHPEHQASFTVAETIGNYAWHSNHHLAHVKQAIESGGSFS